MSRRSAWLLSCCALGVSCGTASAQQSAPPPSPVELPKPQDIEPGVDTSAGSRAPAPAEAPPAPPAPKRGKGSAAAPDARGGTGAAKADGKAALKPTGKALDRLELDSTQITGNRELPKVLYIVPWKRSDLGDLIGRPVNSLLDEVLKPVDRDVFQRQNRYYDALKPDAPRDGDSAAGRPAARGRG
jgi:hypothetical protein